MKMPRYISPSITDTPMEGSLKIASKKERTEKENKKPLTDTDMEYLNQVELRGQVAHVRVAQMGPFKSVRFSVLTMYSFRDKDGMHIVDNTWHKVTAFAGSPETAGVEGLADGDIVHVKGRLRNSRVVASDGSERVLVEVFANVIEKES